MDAPTTVDVLYGEFAQLLDFLDGAQEISMRDTADGNFRKALLLAAASYFEQRLTEAVVVFAQEVTSSDHVVAWLIRNRVVERQYHTWFDWTARNANRFFSTFGDSFGRHMKDVVSENDDLSSSVRAFMEIGRERNRLVHQNFGSFSLEKTSNEIYETYRLATGFVEWFPEALREYSSIRADSTGQGA